MTSAHATLRELVGHLARAERAFDTGDLTEAERAVADALAIDPQNVQASDLRQRIAKTRERVRPARTTRPPWPRQPASTGRPPAAAPPEQGRVSTAAWSSFEQRVRDRRADRAVAEAQEALSRQNRESAEAALAELDAVSPGDSRRDAIVAALAHRRAGRLDTTKAAAPPTPALSITAPIPVDGLATSPDLGSITLDIGATRAALPWSPAAPEREPERNRTWTTAAVAAGAIAASALLGFWLFPAELADSLSAALGQHQSAAPVPSTGAAGAFPDDTTSPPVPAPAPASSGTATDEQIALEEATQAPSENLTQPVQTAGGLDSEPRRDATATPPVTPPAPPPRPAADTALRDRPTAGSDGPIETARAEPAPIPLDAPVQSPIVAPDTRRASDPRGTEPAVRTVGPVPPPAAVASPAAAAVARGAAETSAVRGVLDGYADAFSALNAEATQRVWPGVDLRGLRRAFDQLSAQTVTFNRCDVNAGADAAEAVCVGRATWVPKVGDRSPKSEPRTWRFSLGRDNGEWIIDTVQVQR